LKAGGVGNNFDRHLPKLLFLDPGAKSARISPQTAAQFIISFRPIKFTRTAAILSGAECLNLMQASLDKAEKARPCPVLLAWPGEQAEGKRLACQPEA